MRQRKRKFSSENIINFTPIVLTEYQSGSEEKIWIKNLFNQFIELAQFISRNPLQDEYQEQKADVEILCHDGSIFVSVFFC